MNRGYVLNDLKQADAASKDFEADIKLRPGYGEAYLGLAMAHLQLHRAGKAMGEVNTAEKILGPSRVTHMTRAEAFRQQMRFPDAEKEYRAALTYAPNDPDVELALADTLYRLRRYQEAVDLLHQVATAKHDDAVVYARLAQIHAEMGNQRENVGEGGDMCVGTHEDELAMLYLQGALASGADQDVVAVRMTNAYLAQGKTKSAEVQLATVSADNGPTQNYDYLMAQANVYRQRQENVPALIAFARASESAGNDEAAQQAQFELAAAEGRQVNDTVSLSSKASFSPIFEDIHSYVLNSN